MDFNFTPQQHKFREELREFLLTEVPSEKQEVFGHLTEEQYQLRREFGRRLGAKGWLWPTAETEFGGGGLDVDHSVVLEEEAGNAGLTMPPYYDSGGRLGGASIVVWGSDEQKQHFLPPIFKGLVRAHIAIDPVGEFGCDRQLSPSTVLGTTYCCISLRPLHGTSDHQFVVRVIAHVQSSCLAVAKPHGRHAKEDSALLFGDRFEYPMLCSRR